MTTAAHAQSGAAPRGRRDGHGSEPLSGTVRVYNAGIRLWHWTNALCILTLAVTGYFIGSPPPSQPGEASDSFLFGYIRFAHFAAAYIFAIGFIGRFYMALTGDSHARELFLPPIWRGSWWSGLFNQLAWYLFIAKEPRKYVGHNPLSTLTMFFMYTLMAVFMICTGGAIYSEGEGAASWQHAVFGWVIALFGHNTMALHTWHHVGMWVILLFVLIHIYTAIREDAMSRQSMISAMISGERTYRDNRPN